MSRATNLEQVVRIVRAHPGLTHREIGARMWGPKDQDRVEEAHRRLADAAAAGLIEKGPEVARRGNRAAATWWPKGEEAPRLFDLPAEEPFE